MGRGSLSAGRLLIRTGADVPETLDEILPPRLHPDQPGGDGGHRRTKGVGSLEVLEEFVRDLGKGEIGGGSHGGVEVQYERN